MRCVLIALAITLGISAPLVAFAQTDLRQEQTQAIALPMSNGARVHCTALTYYPPGFNGSPSQWLCKLRDDTVVALDQPTDPEALAAFNADMRTWVNRLENGTALTREQADTEDSARVASGGSVISQSAAGQDTTNTQESAQQQATSPVLWVLGMLALVLVGYVFFLPSIIAFKRRRTDRWSIFVMNLFLGWTVVAWVIFLAWALSYTPAREEA